MVNISLYINSDFKAGSTASYGDEDIDQGHQGIYGAWSLSKKKKKDIIVI